MRRNYWKRIGLLVSITIVASLLLAACGGDDDEPTATPSGSAPTATSGSAPEATATTGGGSLSGRIDIDGSSTVFPVTQAMAEEFNLIHPDVEIPVGVSGTGGGFEKFCAGETDISNASRPIKDSEKEIQGCEANGIEFIELPVAFDGLSVVVNPENDWADCLTVSQLTMMWEPAAEGKITNWNQIDPSFPDAKLDLYGAGTDSGTYDYFTSVITGEEGASRGDFTPSEDDNVLVQGVAGNPNALGFFGYAYYVENQDKLKLVAIDDEDPSNGDGCITPSPETINGGTYQPLSRPIFIYVNAESAKRPEVKAFVDFYLNDGPTIVPEIGYVPLPEEIYTLIDARFNNGVTGSVFAGGSASGVTVQDLLFPEEK
ncbi:MAG: phosphate-binding protein [Chloroflexi bacterium]|nr:MAG: phosphate-binding protein [Chloroflexota bacterium]